MKRNATPCDTSNIESFLNEQLDSQARDSFSLHLESCKDCQQAVRDAAADPAFWKDASRLLSREASVPFDNEHSPAAKGVAVKAVLGVLQPTDDPEMLGRIGEYEISGVVGFGGMGVVFKGFDRSLMRVVAIKVMAPNLATNGSARTRFEREARAAAAVAHDNVVHIYRVSELEGLPYLVMPFARGPSLQKRIEESGPLSTIETIHVGRQIAAGLSAAHEQGLVHRDIKPANILLNDDVERLLITDFGVARAMDDVSMTQTGLIAGTPQFMSPEQARGEVVDPRSDLFSLGAVLYNACTGRPPFRADSPFAVLRKITDTEPRRLREINPDIPEWLENLIHLLLVKDPSQRLGNAQEVAEIFESCLVYLRQPTQTAIPSALATLSKVSFAQPPVKPEPKSAAVFRRPFGKTLGVALAGFALTALAILGYFQLTDAPDISGSWKGEAWNQIQLKSVEEANDWYAGTFVDSKGKRGAVRLEWSRLQQRYDGRWSIGAEYSGTIVLRPADNGRVRGAIALDSTAPADETELRLRDFLWSPGDSSKISRNEPVTPASTDRQRLLTAPVDGTIRRVAPGVQKGSTLKQGDLIVEIQPNLDRSIEDALTTTETKLNSFQSKAKAYQDNVVAFTEARDFAVAASKELANSARAKYQAATNQLAGYDAKVVQANANYDRSKQLFDQGLIPIKQLEKLKIERDVAVAEVESVKNDIKNLKSDWKARDLETEEKKRLAEVKINNAEAMYQDTLGQMATLKKEIADLKTRMSSQELIRIHAPIDAQIVTVHTLTPNARVKTGDVIVQLQPRSKRQLQAPSPPMKKLQPNVAIENPAESFHLSSAPDMLKLAADLKQRMRLAQGRLEQGEKSLNEIEKLIASTEDQIKKLESRVNSPIEADSDGSLYSSLVKRKNELSVYDHQRQDLASGIQVEKDTLQFAQRELATMAELLSLELDAKNRQLEQANKLAELQRIRHEQGDLDWIELQKAEAPREDLETKIQQIKRLLDHFTKIAPKQRY